MLQRNRRYIHDMCYKEIFDMHDMCHKELYDMHDIFATKRYIVARIT